MARCSIIIPVHNRASLTRQCLNALFTQRLGSDCEVIVADDASTDTTPQLLASYGERIRVVTNRENAGFAVTCNKAASVATGEFLVFLNNDTIPLLGWLDALVAYAEENPVAAVVGSKLLFPNDTIQHAGVVICQDRIPRHIYAGFPADHPAVNKSRRFQIVTAACVLIRADAFRRVGGFDSAFKNGYEDVDLCLRLGEQGYEIHYCHESTLYHLESVSEGRFEQITANTDLYRDRWFAKVRPDDLQYYVEDGLLRIDYKGYYPSSFSISPLLGVVNRDGYESSVDWCLSVRARQVFDLLRASIHSDLAAREAAEATASSVISNRQDGGSEEKNLRGPVREPVILSRGRVHSRRGGKAARHLISVLLPTKNGAKSLRALLPAILGQRIDDDLEIIAVDSGSEDESVEVLRAHQATVVSIDPRAFDHGLTRNLAASYAKGDVIVFVNQSVLPANEDWLANLVQPLFDDPMVAGACSRVLPHADADFLTVKDGMRDPSGSAERSVKQISDPEQYRSLSPHALRLLINFHTVSAAIRPEVLRRIPFRAADPIGEDIQWAKDALEAGFKILHEPSSVVYHSHAYSYAEILQRNFDDGAANRKIVGRRFEERDLEPAILSMVADDWAYLRDECGLAGEELERWYVVSVWRRTAQMVGQYLGANSARLPSDTMRLLSLTERIRNGAEAMLLDGKMA